MNNSTRSRLGALAMLAMSLAVTPALAEEPIALGWVGPLSPPGNYSGGQEMQWAVQLGVDEINKAGGVLGRQLQVTYEDTKGQPAEGSAAAVRLITKNNVSAIFGEFHSSVALAEIEEAHKYGVPWVGTDVWADDVTAKQYPEVFRVSPANSLVYVKAADWTVEQGFKNVAIIAENTDFGQGGAKIIASELQAKNVANTLVTIDLNQQDFTPALLRLMSQSPRPDAIQMVIAGQAQYQLVKQACQLGLAPTAETKLIGSSGLLQKEVWEVTGACAKNLLIVNVAQPKSQWNDKAKAFVAAFTERYKRAPTGVALEAYDTLGVVVEGIRKAGSADRAAIVKALEAVKYEGANATYNFPATKTPAWAFHQFMDVPFTIIQYTAENQSPEEAAIVYPKNWATTDKILP
ncbi:ABC transporter substrate-binding protein [Labrys sp. KNU-23]|uniref:ABC transporter substrate-binding protein n=1 Tax=Labrys neptuniae TaxID=376174 RepID=A0ABV3PMW0_9HYPH|nr:MULTISPECIES: ABC transporter substrate-binding protein [Labrys]MDT3381371.1 ABC transporter substrate-binding protein [Labrys neptuniae]QEN85635.1 ABC transporter substrate-binding protein [Labrys sp. KNU-23]